MTELNTKYRGRTKWTEGAKVMFKCLVAKESMKYWELTENKSRVKDKYVNRKKTMKHKPVLGRLGIRTLPRIKIKIFKILPGFWKYTQKYVWLSNAGIAERVTLQYWDWNLEQILRIGYCLLNSLEWEQYNNNKKSGKKLDIIGKVMSERRCLGHLPIVFL